MRRLSLAALTVLAGCHSPEYELFKKQQEKFASSSESSGDLGTTTGDTEPASTGAICSESAEGSAGTTVAGPETTGTSTVEGTTEGSTQTTEGSTGEPMATCGNGMLEAFGPEPEECDDGNLDPDDGCNETCALDRRVFVTSALYQGADIESLYVANALCANHADDQGWPDGLKYRAWLSDSTTDARDQFTRGRGRLVLANGLVFASSWSALLAGQLEYPLEVTEKGETYHGGVWTGTRPDGTAVPGAGHCEDWSTNSILKKGHYGYSDRATPEWTLSAEPDNPISCPAEFALYCFQSL